MQSRRGKDVMPNHPSAHRQQDDGEPDRHLEQAVH
jgi:hypothetical protein